LRVKENRDVYSKRKEKIEQRIETLKETRSDIDKEQKEADEKQSLLQEDAVKKLVMRALEVNETAPWITMAAFSEEDINIKETMNGLKKILQDQSADNEEDMTLNFESKISSDLIDHVTEKAEGKQLGAVGMSVFSSFPKLSELQVDGKTPTTTREWGRAKRGLLGKKRKQEFRDIRILPLVKLGWPEKTIVAEDKVLGALEGQLQDALELHASFVQLPAADRKKLQRLLFDPDGDYCRRQRGRRAVTAQIQDLETELVSKMVLFKLGQKIQEKTLSNLEVWALCAKDGKCSEEEYTRALKACFVDLPFLVVRDEQASMYLPQNHTFGLVVLDEASQSDCTALNLMLRSKQFLVVGDDMQGSSPRAAFLSNVSKATLRARLPNIPRKEQLLPGSSFFDFCKVALPNVSRVFLQVHYRCDPAISKSSSGQLHGHPFETLTSKIPSALVYLTLQLHLAIITSTMGTLNPPKRLAKTRCFLTTMSKKVRGTRRRRQIKPKVQR